MKKVAIKHIDKFSIIVRFDKGTLNDVPKQAQLIISSFLVRVVVCKGSSRHLYWSAGCKYGWKARHRRYAFRPCFDVYRGLIGRCVAGHQEPVPGSG